MKISAFFYKIILWIANFLSEDNKIKLYNWYILKNNEFVLREIRIKNNKKLTPNVLILLPRCLQYSECIINLISSVENCVKCGKCKIRDIVALSEKYNIKIKVATGGKLAKRLVEESNSDYIIAVACETELFFGINEVIKYKVLGVPNIIKEQPCKNTDVEVKKIEDFIKHITSQK